MAGPRSQFSKDRRGPVGKGDLHKEPMGAYHKSDYWGRSNCCNAPIMKLQGKKCCEKCGEYCLKTKVQ